MLSRKYLILILIVSSMIISCGGGALKIRNSTSSEPAMLFGHLNTAYADLTGNCWVSFRHYEGNQKGKRYIAECDELGFFWTANLPMGTYKMEKFGNHGRLGDQPTGMRVIKGLRQFRDSNKVEIRKPGLYYFGSIKVSTGGGGSFGPGMQNVGFTKKPTEARILRAMLEHARGTDWEDRISRRFGELKGK